MGAHSVDLVFSARLTDKEVADKFKKIQKEQDKHLSDDDDLYGRWSDLGYIKFEDKLIKDYSNALDYCLKRAEKWEYCYAVMTMYLKPGAKKRTKVWLVAGWMPE